MQLTLQRFSTIESVDVYLMFFVEQNSQLRFCEQHQIVTGVSLTVACQTTDFSLLLSLSFWFFHKCRLRELLKRRRVKQCISVIDIFRQLDFLACRFFFPSRFAYDSCKNSLICF